MGLFQRIFGRRRPPQAGGFWETLTAYSPAFTSWGGELYESELVRAAIDARARNISKLAPTFVGSAQPKLRAAVRGGPNELQVWSQFLYRLSTILDMQGTAFVVPFFDSFGDRVGYFPVLPARCEVLDVHGDPWLRYHFLAGSQAAALPLRECSVLTKFQYLDDILGTGNQALSGTMDLIEMQRSGIEEGIKNGATFRFMAQTTNFVQPEDLAKERKRFNASAFRAESGGLLLFPNTYKDIKQISQDAYKVDADQMKLIQQNVSNYFGVSEDVLQNKAFGDAWSAFYEGAIEPFAVQLSETMTRMTFTDREIATGNAIFFTANRLQYMSNADKLAHATQLTDRGLMNLDEAREMYQLPPLPNGMGQKYIVRGEYKDAKKHLDEKPDADTNKKDGGDSDADESGGA